MLPYWALFTVWAAGSLQFARGGAAGVSRLFFVAAICLSALLIGLRYHVGGDWSAYEQMYTDSFFLSAGDSMRAIDPGYGLLNWISAQGDLGVWFVNLACGAIFMTGLAHLARQQQNPWLAILVAVPYLIIVVAMGYTRQAAAIGFICWAIADARADRLPRIVVLIGLAALFHKTAVVFLPILLAPAMWRNPILALAGTVAFVLLANVLLAGSADALVTNYVNSSYDSQGAGIRVAMNVVAAAVFLLLRNRMGFDPYQQVIWTICAILACVSVVALATLSASSGIDRLALFLIPLQVVTFSRLPYALSQTARPLPSLMLGVLLYSLSVQLVWLNFADNAGSWLPYRMSLFADGSSG